MPFPEKVREDVLVRSARRCCVCREFAGRSVNVHHIIPEADGGLNAMDNAIALCLKCHAEAGHFNNRHPLGTKYSPSELRKHRDLWWQYVASNPVPGEPESRLSGQGGRGGNARVGGSGIAIGGSGGGAGARGAGNGGAGGDASIEEDGFALGGEGGEAGQLDRGGRGGRSPLEVLGIPNVRLPDGTWLWDKGKGGDGGV